MMMMMMMIMIMIMIMINLTSMTRKTPKRSKYLQIVSQDPVLFETYRWRHSCLLCSAQNVGK